jgi:hypothetical protein
MPHSGRKLMKPNSMQTELSAMTTKILENHFDVNAFDENWVESLQRTLNNPKSPDRAQQFRKEFGEIIRNQLLSPTEYERLTGEDFDSQIELDAWLREVWEQLYGESFSDVS